MAAKRIWSFPSFWTSDSRDSETTSLFFSTTIPFSVRLRTRSLSKISLCTTLIGCSSFTGNSASFFSGVSLTVSFGTFSCLASVVLSLFRLNLANPPFESPTFSAPPLITLTRGFFSFGSTGVVSSVAIMACWSKILYINSFFLKDSILLTFSSFAIWRKSESNFSFSSKISYI